MAGRASAATAGGNSSRVHAAFARYWLGFAAFSATRSDMLVNHGSVGNVSANFTPNDEINTGDHSWQRTLRIAGLRGFLVLGLDADGCPRLEGSHPTRLPALGIWVRPREPEFERTARE